MKSAPANGSGRIVFFAGSAWERWSPATIEQDGIGGSETALVRVAEVLASRGWPVEVYFDSFEGNVNGVSYRPFERWEPGDTAAAFVSNRLPEAFDRAIAAPVRALWCHDAHLGDALTPERAQKMTGVIAVSDWHRSFLAERYPFLAGKVQMVRNGVSLRTATGESAFPDAQRPFAERLPHCIYSSNPGKGLRLLLELWPGIRTRVPEAELHLFSGWEIYDRIAEQSHSLRASKVMLLHLLAQAQQSGGVVVHGRVGQPELHAAMQWARVWSYTALLAETSCISAMEARAAGLPIVTSDLAALPETIGRERGVLVSLDDQVAYREAFSDAVVRLLSDEGFWTEKHEQVLGGIAELDWSVQGEHWERVLGLRPLEENRHVPSREDEVDLGSAD
jgi:glycosyltransferase involved in cell wall biosynthesis